MIMNEREITEIIKELVDTIGSDPEGNEELIKHGARQGMVGCQTLGESRGGFVLKDRQGNDFYVSVVKISV
jgi:hypothetical protein